MSTPAQAVRLELPSNQVLRVETVGAGTPAWLPAVVTGLGAIITSLIALTATLIAVTRSNAQNAENNKKTIQSATDSANSTIRAATENAQKAINQKANELEIEAIEKRLSSFFGPFMQLSAENKRIADVLRARQGRDFRTLKALLDESWQPSDTDRTLVDTIVSNDKELRQLIREQGGAVSPTLLAYLSRASAHFTIIELAHGGKLKDRTDDFIAYVYPRQLDRVLELECQRLEARRQALRSALAAHHEQAPDLSIPNELALNEDKPSVPASIA